MKSEYVLRIADWSSDVCSSDLRPAALPPRLGRLALMLWLAVVAVSLFVSREGIAALDLRDADDLMRLAEVRDLIAGQSWFDVTQYRINPAGGGGPMHWSRFIDAQIVDRKSTRLNSSH